MMKQGITERQVPKVEMRIDDKLVAGRNVFGFFLTEEEFEKISSIILARRQSRSLGPLKAEISEFFLADCTNLKSSSPDPEYEKKIDTGIFIVGSESWMIKKLLEYGLPIRRFF